MATIQNDILKFEIKNIISLYTEFSNINNENDIGTYEAFDCNIQIGNATILNKNLELCSGNIHELLEGIDDILVYDKRYRRIEFQEPDLEFNIVKILDNHVLFEVKCYTSVLGDKSNNDNAIVLQFDLTQEELWSFRDDLQQAWDNRKKIYYDECYVLMHTEYN